MNFRERLKWLMSFRLAFVLVMTVSALILQSVYNDPITPELVRMLKSGFAFGLAAVMLFPFARNSKQLTAHAIAQTVWDLGYTTLLIYMTGGLYSAFVLLYAVHIILTATVFLSRGAIIAGLGSAVSLTFVSVFQLGRLIYQEPNLISRTLFNASILLLFAGLVAWLFRLREKLAKRLEQTSADLQGLSELHSAIVDHVPSGILYAGPDGRVQLMNRAAMNILQKSYMDQKLDDSEIQFLNLDNGRYESDFKNENTQKRIGHHLTKLPNGGSVIVFQDVTQVRELEAKVQLQDKLATVGQLAAGIAHEIRNPLASLSGSIQLLKAEASLKESSDKLMKIVLRETDRLDHLLQSFLNYAKPSNLRVERVEVLNLVDELLSLIQNNAEYRARNISIQTKIAKDLKCVCDPAHLKQILWNLVKNSIEAIPASGEIQIVATERDYDGASMIVFSVEDNGSGIEKEIIDRIFDPFFSTKAAGTGLGLALVYQLVKSHSGQMGVESEKTRGTRFWFALHKEGPVNEVQLHAESA